MRILYYGDASWGARALVEVVQRGHRVVGVVVRVAPTDGEMATVAKALGLPVFQPDDCNCAEFLRVVRGLAPDLNLSASYDQILRREILETAPLGFVNFHAGKLPLYRGRSVINWALINGEKEVGVTAHYVDEGIDTGDILLQRTVEVAWEDTYAEVMARTVEVFIRLVADTVDMIAAGPVERTVQRHLPGTYFPRRGVGDEWLDWSDSSFNIYNKIRAISDPGPGARTRYGRQEWIVWRARYERDWPRYIATPGQVVGNEHDGVRVKTGDSTVVLTEVETVGVGSGRRVPRIQVGRRLGVNWIKRVFDLERRLEKMGGQSKDED